MPIGLASGYPVLREDGQPDPKRLPWFSLEIRQGQFPWVFEKGGRPSPKISTLEALAVPGGAEGRRKKVLVMPTWTDNRGNGAALDKLMTTRYPASAVLVDLASHMKALALKVQVEWTCRSGNKEADELTQDDFRKRYAWKSYQASSVGRFIQKHFVWDEKQRRRMT